MNIFHGITLSNFFTGIAVIALGIMILMSNSVIPGIIILYLGILIFLSIKGILIDPVKHRIKSYHYIYPFKIGSWKALIDFKVLKLGITNTSQVMNSRGSTTTVRTKSFDVSLLNAYDVPLELKEFDSYDEAKAFSEEISKLIKMPVADYFKQIQDN